MWDKGQYNHNFAKSTLQSLLSTNQSFSPDLQATPGTCMSFLLLPLEVAKINLPIFLLLLHLLKKICFPLIRSNVCPKSVDCQKWQPDYTTWQYICGLSCQQVLGLLLSKYGHMIFNMHNDQSACCVQTGEKGTDESAQMLTRRNWKPVCHPATSWSQTLATGFIFQRIRVTSSPSIRTKRYMHTWMLRWSRSSHLDGKSF